MNSFVLKLKDIDKTKLHIAGGKAANLGELFKIETILVPDGFCISTEAFKKIIEISKADKLLHQLSLLKKEDRSKIIKLGNDIRGIIENAIIPQNIRDEIVLHLSRLGEQNAYAIRSSATAEDLPTASFAGQQDTYLNVIGKDFIFKNISKCWASLFTERAITYRIQNGFDHRKIYLAVIVQKMIFPQAAGVLFTADPVTSNRKILSIDAGYGLGEALVSGIVNADNYKVRNGKITERKIAGKHLAVYAVKNGGTKERKIEVEQQHKQVLTNGQILQLEYIGRKIEAYFGVPQDVEWCLEGDQFYIVQSRPITTLYPVPEADDAEDHVYVSVGHQQMMTDAMKPLGISVWMLTGARPIFKTGGGRLFVDITKSLASTAGKQNLLDVLGHSDPLIKDALITIIERDFIKPDASDKSEPGPVKSHKGMSAADILAEAGSNPAIVADLIKSSETSLSALKQNIQTKSGSDVFDCILEDTQQRKQRATDLKNLNVIMAGIHASAWLNEKMNDWLYEKNVADTLSLSVQNNITSEMGMELLDVADVIRPYPEIIKYLQQAKNDRFLNELIQFKGGQEAHDAIVVYLNKYGMRCAGEIDITRIRWAENPAILIPAILNNIKNFEPGESRRKFEQGRQDALNKQQDLLTRLKQLPDGEQKAEETKKLIGLLRSFTGYREYPKYDIVSRYFVYKQALLKEAEQLLQANIINEKEDIYYLSFEELHEVVSTGRLDQQIINLRKDEYKHFKKLTPPRVITSEGEIITGKYNKENLPPGAVAGLAVSSGIIEGRARVILNMKDAAMEEGDILVTSFTDPGWTPLFVSIKGLVTEVGGLMTHGAVIAREYGLPAVVGVENAVTLIKDGQKIRVNGTDGYVEFL
ncbi:phosphoenolpyruvate synthase [Parafilimonas terrae]|uniref:Prodigiosin synthesizing transferase PigC n=1 Tax=Parafilimonas terrae TaxID=1465490 RepID=A0A1I5X039_9BACT|nr:phosphoenolpyruvate synthase [Parafilimonas terrae]SFQ25270.1 pyruvate, water dikinase [Parafilimonas terrae]